MSHQVVNILASQPGLLRRLSKYSWQSAPLEVPDGVVNLSVTMRPAQKNVLPNTHEAKTFFEDRSN